MIAPLVRERSTVQSCPAAPFFPLEYKVVGDGRRRTVQAEPSVNRRRCVAGFWQVSDGPDFYEYECSDHMVDMPSPACLYRYYGSSGDLIYVGISSRPSDRDYQHRGKYWYRDVVAVFSAFFPCRNLAEHAEAAAILHEDPLENLHMPNKPMIGVARYIDYFEMHDWRLCGDVVGWRFL